MNKILENHQYPSKHNNTACFITRQNILMVHRNKNLVNAESLFEYLNVENIKKIKRILRIACDNSEEQEIYFQHQTESKLFSVILVNTANLKASTTLAEKCFLPDASAGLIRLTKEQFNTFQEKGWIKLEVKDEVFLLDGMGLRIVTNDDDLLNTLENSGCPPLDLNSPTMRRVENPENGNANNVYNQQPCKEQSVPGKVDNVTNIELQGEDSKSYLTRDKLPMRSLSVPTEPQIENRILRDDRNYLIKTKNKRNNIYLKTPYLLKDIPKKIVLGKTFNGKKLVARFVNRIPTENEPHIENEYVESEARPQENQYGQMQGHRGDPGAGPMPEGKKFTQIITETQQIYNSYQKLTIIRKYEYYSS